MVGEMVQNSQSLYSFSFNAVIVIHEYIYSQSTTNFTLKKYIYSHLMMYFFFTNIFTWAKGDNKLLDNFASEQLDNLVESFMSDHETLVGYPLVSDTFDY